MTARAKREGPSLFAAAGLDRDAPRPLADKLRPTKLGEVSYAVAIDAGVETVVASASASGLLHDVPADTSLAGVQKTLATLATWPALSLTVAPTHRDKGNDADFNININLPAMHDKPGCLGTVRSSSRSGRRSAVGLCVRLRTCKELRGLITPGVPGLHEHPG